MSKIRIKNFGPIKEGYQENDGWIDIKKVTVFIGNQGSGKSTLAKVISSFVWLEKAINRGDIKKDRLTEFLFLKIFKYQKINNYFTENSLIEYQGEKIQISFLKGIQYPRLKEINSNTYSVPKIMYVPSERNLLSVVKNAFGIKTLPDTLYTFAEELRKGQLEINNNLIELPVGDLKYKYDAEQDVSYLSGKDYEIDLVESSSGYQSFIPLYLVTKFLSDELQKGENVLREQLSVEQSVRRNKEIADLMFNNTVSEAEKNKRIKEIDSKYLNTCFINIVEEPEQNLFPTSQRRVLNCLLDFNNKQPGSKLIMTTHSPYLINYLTLAVKANTIADKAISKNISDPSWKELDDIVPMGSWIKGEDLGIYEIDEKGNIIKLGDYNGLPSDDNYLNNKLAEGNELFSQLLEIQQTL